MSEYNTTNYAEKYEGEVDERFKLSSLTDSAVNNNFSFDGVNSINVYSVETSELNNYKRNGTSRYGTPKELGSALQKLTLTQDKAFTFTIDKGNHNDSVMMNSAASALGREIDEVVTPTIDRYRLAKIAKNAGTVIEQDITIPNAYQLFLDAITVLTENLVPVQNRIAFVTPEFYKKLKLDRNFTGSADRVNEIAVNGAVGKVDNISIIVAPTSYLPPNVNYIITHPAATLGPIKLADYTIHDKPPGINGWLCEGRVYYDAFVLENKKKAIIVSKKLESEPTDPGTE
jgi:gp7